MNEPERLRRQLNEALDRISKLEHLVWALWRAEEWAKQDKGIYWWSDELGDLLKSWDERF